MIVTRNNKQPDGHLQLQGLQRKNKRLCTTKITTKIIKSNVANGNRMETRILIPITIVAKAIKNFGTTQLSLLN